MLTQLRGIFETFSGHHFSVNLVYGNFFFRDAPNGTQMPPNPITVAAYDEYGLDDMTRQRHVYETAFDCRINKSDDDLDQIDKVSNHPVLVQINNTWDTKPGSEPSIDSSTLNKRNRARENCQKSSQEDNNTVLALSQDIQVLFNFRQKKIISFTFFYFLTKNFHGDY